MQAPSRRMRVLHVWNTGGAASIIAKFTDVLYQTESTVITRKASDPVGLTTYGTAYGDGAVRFFVRALLASRSYDLVHVHSLDRLVPWLKWDHPRKPVVLYYLGTDIRGLWEEKKPRWSKADFVGYTTSDLGEGAPPKAKQVFCPVDTEAFPHSSLEKAPGTAVSIRYGMDAETERMAKSMSLVLTLVDRGSVPYSQMPSLLSKYEYYLDLRRPPERKSPVECLGKAALEALASGCKAVDWSGKVYEGLPKENRPEVAAAAWYEVYSSLLPRS